MDCVPPPYPDDVDWDTGPYSRDELVGARASLLHSLQRENGGLWQAIKYKLGILPNGYRMRTMEAQHIWLPPELPHLWSAPVVLHDPNNPLSTVGDDDDGGEGDGGEGEKVGGEKRSSTSTSASASSSSSSSRSNSRAGRASSETSNNNMNNNKNNDDDNNSASTSFSRKRNRDSTCDLTRDDDDDDDGGGDGGGDDSRQKGKKKSPAKKRKVGGGGSGGGGGGSGGGGGGSNGDDGPESGNNSGSGSGAAGNVSVIEVSSEGEEEERREYTTEKEYVRVHQCDVCGFLSQDHMDLHHHLDQERHCSSSLYLALRKTTRLHHRSIDNSSSSSSKPKPTLTLTPAFLSVASKIQKRQHAFRDKVVFCHSCHLVFTCLAQCLQHTFQAHREEGEEGRHRYVLRDVLTEETVTLEKGITHCPDCSVSMGDKEVVAHTRKHSQHMALYMGRKSVGATMLFVCPFCKAPYTDYLSFKAHVFSGRHADEAGDEVKAFQALLGPAIPKTMLPQDPGGLNIVTTEHGPGSSQSQSHSQAPSQQAKKASAKASFFRSKKKQSKKILREKLAAVKAEAKRNLS